MRETSKSAMRRWPDGAFQSRYFVGHGIDIGAGEDTLGQFVGAFPKMESVRAWDISDGDAQYMNGVGDESFDFVHSSHCLEHLADPREALHHWLRILKPGGFLIVTIPDEDLYEGGQWPSLRNQDHRWSFTIQRHRARHDHSINVLDLVREFAVDIECESVRQLRDFYRDDLNGVDQTLGPAECAIELVWRKRVRHAPALVQHAVQLEAAGDDAGAEAAYLAALEDSPDCFDAYNRLAHLYNCHGRRTESVNVWERCVQALPHWPVARMYQALNLIAVGQYDRGFAIRDPLVGDARRTPTAPPEHYPRWQGEDLTGRSIVIWTEFGFGDEIMFARFAAVFKQRLGAKTVSLVCQAPLVPLMKTLEHVDTVIARESAHELPAHDFWVFGHSIPVHYSLELHGVPADMPYLASPYDSEAAQTYRSAIGLNGGELKVGLVWRGSPTHENDFFRSMRGLDVLEALFDVPNVHWVSLQAEGAGAEIDAYTNWDCRISDVGPSFKDFGDTAAAVEALDLVIAVDTSIVHVAGAMGKPVWVLLPSLSDWRWGVGLEHPDWYPNIRIFRQKRLGQWADVVQRVKGELLRWIEERAATKHLLSVEEPAHNV
jgi:tetratricopeptide (TPR) repeat protein